LKRKANRQAGGNKQCVSRKSRWKRSLVLLALLICAAVLVPESYPAGDAARAAMPERKLNRWTTVFEAEMPKAGLVFYPGALVDHEAYAPLMQAAAARGVTCFLIQMPFDLAVMNRNAAQGIAQQMPDIDYWIIGGHSLGGAMAAAYAADHPQEFDALVLLGAYAQADLSDTEMDVLSVLGSNDDVLNRDKYEQYRSNYPESFREFMIEGGCHAFFGDYGMQRGDGEPSVSREMQIGLTASAIASLIH